MLSPAALGRAIGFFKMPPFDQVGVVVLMGAGDRALRGR
jgi:hypothetical protein